MRIAFFNWRDIRNPMAGGAEILTHQLLKGLIARGHKATLFTSSFKGALPSETIDGIDHIRYGGRFSIYANAYSCYKRHIEGRYDIIIENINGVPFFTPLFARERVVPFIYQLTRENWFSGLVFPLSLIGYHLEDLMLRPYSGLPAIALSKSTKEDLLALGFKDVSVVEPGIEALPSSGKWRKESLPTIIFLGRLVKSKRADHALRAFSAINAEIPGSRLWIVGSGSEEARLKGLARELGIQASVIFHGKVDEKRKSELLSRAHMALFPAVREGWGLVVLEANMCGTPVIGYDVPGLRDSIQDGKNGFLSPSGDYGGMAKSAISLFGDSDGLKRLSASSIAHAKKYTWEGCVDEFESVLERCRT